LRASLADPLLNSVFGARQLASLVQFFSAFAACSEAITVAENIFKVSNIATLQVLPQNKQKSIKK